MVRLSHTYLSYMVRLSHTYVVYRVYIHTVPLVRRYANLRSKRKITVWKKEDGELRFESD